MGLQTSSSHLTDSKPALLKPSFTKQGPAWVALLSRRVILVRQWEAGDAHADTEGKRESLETRIVYFPGLDEIIDTMDDPGKTGIFTSVPW